MNERLRVGALLTGMLRMINGNLVGALIALVLATAVATVFDLLQPDTINNLPASLAGAVMQFVLTKTALGRVGLLHRGRSAVLSFIGLNICTSMGILLGMLLLIVPGLILAARWSASLPILLAEDVGVGESLGESWRRTEGNTVSILLAFLVVAAPFLVLLVASAAVAAAGPAVMPVSVDPAIQAGLTNLAAYAAQIVGVYLNVAIYAAVTVEPEGVEQVFA